MAEKDPSPSPPLGQRFTHVYGERGDPVPDSTRMRKRIAALFSGMGLQRIIDATALFEGELGVEVVHYTSFFEDAELHDLLDSITLVHHALVGRRIEPYAARWRDEVSRIFQEENVGYKLDKHAGVHLSVDSEFERSRASAIAALQKTRYAAAAAEFEKAYKALDAVPPDTKTAVRAVFEANEIVFRLMCPNAPRLGTAEIRSHLRPIIDKQYGSDAVALRAASRHMASLEDWVEGVHFYRHGQGAEEPSPPPLPLALTMISSGTGYLRWLAELDAANSQG